MRAKLMDPVVERWMVSAELLAAVVQKHYSPISDPTGVDGAQMWDGRWWMPLGGCDTLDSMLGDMAYAVARMEA